MEDAADTLQKLYETYAGEAVAIDNSDGYCFEFADWRFNIRMSNTEPVVRLNVESRDLLERDSVATQSRLRRRSNKCSATIPPCGE